MSRHAVTQDAGDRARSAHASVAGLAAVVAVLAGVLPLLGPIGPGVVVALLQAGLVWSWVMGTASPGRIGGLLLGFGAAALADVLLIVRTGDGLAPLLIVYGLLLPALLVHQLTRGVVRTRLTESLSGVALSSVASAALACYLELEQTSSPVAGAALLAAGVSLLAGYLVDLVWPGESFGEGAVHSVVGVIGSAVFGGAAAVLRLHGDFSSLRLAVLGVALGSAVGLAAVGATFIVQTVHPRRTAFAPLTLPVLRVLLPLALTAPIAYLLGMFVVR